MVDDGFTLDCTSKHKPSLLLTNYRIKRFSPDDLSEGIYRYRAWLPVRRELRGSSLPGVFKSAALSAHTGLENLWLSFSGYWPSKNANFCTCTFKELESFTTVSRLPTSGKIMVLASAGNTAAAYAWTCSQTRTPCVIIVPQRAMEQMQFPTQIDPCVHIMALKSPADYHDATVLCDNVAHEQPFFSEGGVRNVARRDGIGAMFLWAVESMGKVPDYYFQAVGGGVGALAVLETSKRLVEDGQFGRRLPRLMLSQNFPFTPMFDAWRSGRSTLLPLDREVARTRMSGVIATVLSSYQPAYAIAGGVFDALRETDGDMFSVSNDEALTAMRLFERFEGIDIDPAAGVALASLLKCAPNLRAQKDSSILLHLTGGGRGLRSSNCKQVRAQPSLIIGLDPVEVSRAVDAVLRHVDAA